MGWYGVRCIFELTTGSYEERITVWRADSADAAIELAETEAEDYAEDIGRYLGLAQSYEMYDELSAGAEVYSLIRDSELAPDEYLSRYFVTGAEHERHE